MCLSWTQKCKVDYRDLYSPSITLVVTKHKTSTQTLYIIVTTSFHRVSTETVLIIPRLVRVLLQSLPRWIYLVKERTCRPLPPPLPPPPLNLLPWDPLPPPALVLPPPLSQDSPAPPLPRRARSRGARRYAPVTMRWMEWQKLRDQSFTINWVHLNASLLAGGCLEGRGPRAKLLWPPRGSL